jgi:hypothetical protein
MAQRKKPPYLDSSFVPQFDSLKRLLQVLATLSQGPLSEETIDLSKRHIDYAKQAARCLGLISETGELTRTGVRVLRLSGEAQKRLLRKQFETSACGTMWLGWTMARSLAELEPGSASDFLAACTSMSESMVSRRSRTLERWCRDLSPIDAPPRGTHGPTPRARSRSSRDG